MIFNDPICRAQRKDNGEWIEGTYFCLHHNDERTHVHHMLIPMGADLSLGTPIEKIQVEVIPESITMKAQEPIAPKVGGNNGFCGTHWYLCGACLSPIDPGDKYCRKCGRAIWWGMTDNEIADGIGQAFSPD